MLLRPGLRLQTIIAAFAAVIAMLMYTLSAPGSHSPRLHAASAQVVDAGKHHDHGDHSHDDFELADAAGDVTDHHHADHTHEKAELVAATEAGSQVSASPIYFVATVSLIEGPPYGIERPPRAVTLT